MVLEADAKQVTKFDFGWEHEAVADVALAPRRESRIRGDDQRAAAGLLSAPDHPLGHRAALVAIHLEPERVVHRHGDLLDAIMVPSAQDGDRPGSGRAARRGKFGV